MKRVYLLGTGASRELSFNITTLDGGLGTKKTDKFLVNGPLSSGYFYDANNFAKVIKDRLPIVAQLKVSDSLIHYIKDYYKTKFGKVVAEDDILNNETISRNINIESLYLHIEQEIGNFEKVSQSQKGGLDEHLIRLHLIKHDLLEYIHTSLSIISYYCFSIYHKVLASYIVNYGGDIISFNWDILLEEEMQHTGSWAYQNGYRMDFRDIIYRRGDKQPAFSDCQSNNCILKPHGSINWYKRTNDENGLYLFMTRERRLRGGSLDILRLYEYDNERKQYSASIVPPGFKSLSYSDIWIHIKKVLENVDDIIAIGFSFNDNDRHIKEEFADINFKKDLHVNLVNPDSNRLIAIYREVFKTSNVSPFYNTFADYCQWIVRQKEMEKLESLLQ